MTFAIAVQMACAAALLYSCYCRLVFTNRETFAWVRWGIWFKGVAAAFVLGAPVWPLLYPQRITWEPWTTPYWAWLLLLGAVCVAQIAQSRLFWANGVPCAMQKHHQ